LRLLLLLLVYSLHFIVFLDHTLHYSIYLSLLSDILLIGFLSESVGLINLILNCSLVLSELVKLLLVFLPLIHIIDLFVLQHDHVDLGVLFDFLLVTELLLNHLLIALFVQISSLDLVLKEFQFVGLGAQFLDFSSLALVVDLLASQLSSQLFLHASHIKRCFSTGC